MEEYIKITYLNDFIFCPLSIYFHQLYGSQSEISYYNESQMNGKAAHVAIDEKRYSTHSNILQAIDIFSEEYKLCGKIDIFDMDKSLLTERKKKISTIYDGYIFQLYAQYFCLTEMGYMVKNLRFYSFDTNKVFPIPLPQDDFIMFEKFKHTIQSIREFNIEGFIQTNDQKCKYCIYNNFCDRTLV